MELSHALKEQSLLPPRKFSRRDLQGMKKEQLIDKVLDLSDRLTTVAENRDKIISFASKIM